MGDCGGIVSGVGAFGVKVFKVGPLGVTAFGVMAFSMEALSFGIFEGVLGACVWNPGDDGTSVMEGDVPEVR